MATAKNINSENLIGTARLVGLGACLPFVICAVGIWFAPETVYFWFFDWLLTYGAVFLGFLGAVHFGAAMTQNLGTWRPFVWSVVPALIGWLALLMNPVPAFSCLAFGYVAAFFADQKAVRTGLLPPLYMSLRKPMTLLALSAMTLAIARIATA